jgi:hypothetical protein
MWLCLAVALSAAAPPGRVLFVGNSLTYMNDLPGMVSALVDSSGAGPIEIHSVTAPNFSLGDHLENRSAEGQIRRHRPELLVLQQGPSSMDDSRADLIASTQRFDSLVRQVGGRAALYGVWPGRAREAVFDRVSESYRLAAERVHGVYLPAGEGWRAAWRRDSTLALYDADQFHPSILGTYVAALVIYQRITGRSPVGLPARLRSQGGVDVDIPPRVARLLQDAAAEANARFPS